MARYRRRKRTDGGAVECFESHLDWSDGHDLWPASTKPLRGTEEPQVDGEQATAHRCARELRFQLVAAGPDSLARASADPTLTMATRSAPSIVSLSKSRATTRLMRARWLSGDSVAGLTRPVPLPIGYALAFPCYSGSSQAKHVTQGLLYESLTAPSPAALDLHRTRDVVQ